MKMAVPCPLLTLCKQIPHLLCKVNGVEVELNDSLLKKAKGIRDNFIES